MERYDVVIVGAGFAGAATAWWLRRLGVDSVLLLEQEQVPGAHASGKNAGMARQAVPEPIQCLLAARSVSFFKAPPDGFTQTPLFAENGGLFLGPEPDDPRLEQLRHNAMASGVFTYFGERLEAIERAPVLQDAPFHSALICPTDGLVDIHSLLSAFLRGSALRTGARVQGFESSGGRLTAVKTGDGSIRCEHVVLAAGAWSHQLGGLAGGLPVPVTPRRRHLIHSGPIPWADPLWPYVWCLNPEVYFRPESGGFLLSPCDEAVFQPGSPPTDPEAPLWLASRLSEAVPRMSSIPVARSWSELRSFTPDGEFCIGPDPMRPNLFWVCGLGGHGMTTSAAVGELAAQLITGSDPFLDPAPMAPGRFA